MPQRAHQRRRHAAQFLVLRHQQEGPQDAVRVAVEGIGDAQVEQFAAGDEGLVEWYRRLVGRVKQPQFDVLQHDGVHLGDRLGRPVVALHQHFACAACRGGVVTGALGHGLLHIEHEPVLAPAGHEVQPGADFLDATFAAADQTRFLRRDEPVASKLRPARAVAAGAGEPQQHMQVAQSARAFLHVRLEAVRRLVVLDVTLPLLEHLCAEVGGAIQRFADRALEALEQPLLAGDAARLEQRSQHGNVSPRLGPALVDSADAVAQREPEVPQQSDEPLDRGAFGRVGFVLEQDQDVDIGMREELAPAIAADGDQRGVLLQARALGQLAQQAVGRAGEALEQPFNRSAGLKACDQGITLQSQAIPLLETDVVHPITRWRARAW